MTLSDFVGQLSMKDSPRAVWRLSRGYLIEQRVTRLSYHPSLPLSTSSHRALGPQVFNWGYPVEWAARYRDQGYALIDPIPELALRRGTPFCWSEVSKITGLTDQQRQFLADLKRQNLGDGVAMGVYGPYLRNAYIGVCLEAGAACENTVMIRDLYTAMQSAHFRLCELTAAENPTFGLVSPREREVLYQIAIGKSNGVIADVMGVSRHTVDTLVRRLFAKLCVSDRTAAVIAGLASGLVQTGGDGDVTQLRD